ncbi:MAG: hypothetical protein MJK18_02665, partial [Bdellovibrionales bacterium]|nr:hypothetical protein [Bdellovibrionales bacterium]
LEYLKAHPIISFILLGSPLVLLGFLPLLQQTSLHKEAINVIYGSIFLGSFHIVMTPLMQNILFDSSALTKKVQTRSLYYLAFGFSCFAIPMILVDQNFYLVANLCSLIVVGSIIYHSQQQQLGVLMVMTDGSDKLSFKKLYDVLFGLVLLDWTLFVFKGHGNFSKDLMFGLVSFVIALMFYRQIISVKQKSFYVYAFLTRALFWPAAIYYPELRVVTFAMHGVEYFAFYKYFSHKAQKSGLRGPTGLNIEFFVILTLTAGSYLIGKTLVVSNYNQQWIIFFTSLHFSLQFRHYWIDRQLFSGPKYHGKKVQAILS